VTAGRFALALYLLIADGRARNAWFPSGAGPGWAYKGPDVGEGRGFRLFGGLGAQGRLGEEIGQRRGGLPPLARNPCQPGSPVFTAPQRNWGTTPIRQTKNVMQIHFCLREMGSLMLVKER